VRVPRAAQQRGMLPRAVSDREYDASRELDSILPKVYDIYKAYSRSDASWTWTASTSSATWRTGV
jgi:hypothetical protein